MPPCGTHSLLRLRRQIRRWLTILNQAVDVRPSCTLVLLYGLPAGVSLFTVGAAAPLPPSNGAAVIPSVAQARPLVSKGGKAIVKYVVKLRPTKVNGKVIGDIGAWGKAVAKAIRRSASKYYIIYKVKVMNIRSGGAVPDVGSGSSCVGAVVGQQTWVNTTTNKSGRRKRYSFTTTTEFGPMSEKDARVGIKDAIPVNSYVVAVHANNKNALCGMRKKKGAK